MENKILTKKGLNKLKKELEDLKHKKRPEIAERIRQAKELGDLSENAEYHQAKDEQSFIEGRVLELEHLIKTCEIAEENTNNDEVGVGSKVTVSKDGATLNLTIVGSTEADPSNGRISLESPIGEALLGKKVGDEVEVELPAGVNKYRVVNIE